MSKINPVLREVVVPKSISEVRETLMAILPRLNGNIEHSDEKIIECNFGSLLKSRLIGEFWVSKSTLPKKAIIQLQYSEHSGTTIILRVIDTHKYAILKLGFVKKYEQALEELLDSILSALNTPEVLVPSLPPIIDSNNELTTCRVWEMKISCSNCNQRLEIPEELAGQTIECPACKASLSVPESASNLDDTEIYVPLMKQQFTRPQTATTPPKAASSKKSKSLIPKLAIAAIAGVVVVVLIMFFSGPQTPDISIHDAAREDNIEAVKQHLAAGTDVNAKNNGGDTPLHYLLLGAPFTDRMEVVELLIENGADVNAKGGMTGATPLHFAAMVGYKEIVELLIAKGADVNAKDNNNGTPLDLAEKGEHKEIADLLRKPGPGRKRIHELLRNIRLERFPVTGIVDNLALRGIVLDLHDTIQVLDEKGINIIIDQNTDIGLEAAITIYPPLRNVTLGQTLEIIVKLSNIPIKYSVEEWGIIFSQAPVEGPRLNSALNTELSAVHNNTGPGRKRIHELLRNIRLERFPVTGIVDNLALRDIVLDLHDTIQRIDEEGINIIIKEHGITLVDPFDTDPNDPFGGGAGFQTLEHEEVNIAIEAAITIDLPLRNVTLGQTLEIIVKHSNIPIKYSVEEWGIIFSQAPVEGPRLESSE